MSANEVTSCESLSCGGRPYMEDRTMTAREGDTFFAATNCAELCNLSGFSAEASAFQPASKADKFVSVQSSADITHVPSLRQVFDGHGGSDAADYAKANLWKTLKAHALYNSNSPEGVKEAIREAFLTTHKGMEAALPTWPRRADGFNSTAGTTCTVCLLRGVQLWTAHVGDSRAVLSDGHQAITLTKDHKASDPDEQKTLNARGGEVVKVTARNLARVVWRRPKIVTGGKVTRNTPIQKIPFLNMTRSLGDLWSWNPGTEDYNVSPDPDISYRTLSPTNTTLVLASDGVWDVLSAEECLGTVAETMNRAVAAAVATAAMQGAEAEEVSVKGDDGGGGGGAAEPQAGDALTRTASGTSSDSTDSNNSGSSGSVGSSGSNGSSSSSSGGGSSGSSSSSSSSGSSGSNAGANAGAAAAAAETSLRNAAAVVGAASKAARSQQFRGQLAVAAAAAAAAAAASASSETTTSDTCAAAAVVNTSQRRWGTLRRGRADNISAIVVFTQFATAECACAFVVPGGKNPLLTRHLTTSTDPPEYSLDEPAARMKDVDEAATAAAMLAPPAAAMATVAGTPAAAVIAAAGRNRSGGGGEGGAIACGSSATTVQKKRRPVGIRGIAEDVEMAETASAGAGAGADADGARDGPNAKRIRLIDPAAVADEVRPIVVTPTLPEPEA